MTFAFHTLILSTHFSPTFSSSIHTLNLPSSLVPHSERSLHPPFPLQQLFQFSSFYDVSPSLLLLICFSHSSNKSHILPINSFLTNSFTPFQFLYCVCFTLPHVVNSPSLRLFGYTHSLHLFVSRQTFPSLFIPPNKS